MDTISQDQVTPVPVDLETAVSEPAKPIGKRRKYSKASKRRIVEETLTGRDSVSVVARRHDINTNQLFTWRRQYRDGLLADEPNAQPLIPVSITPAEALEERAEKAVKAEQDVGRVEITLAGGHRLLVTGSVCPKTLRTVLAVLSAC